MTSRRPGTVAERRRHVSAPHPLLGARDVLLLSV